MTNQEISDLIQELRKESKSPFLSTSIEVKNNLMEKASNVIEEFLNYTELVNPNYQLIQTNGFPEVIISADLYSILDKHFANQDELERIRQEESD